MTYTVLNTEPVGNIHPVMKKRICHHVTGANFFNKQKRVYMHEIHDELKSKYTGLYDLIYNRTAHYTNRERLLTVVVSQAECRLVKAIAEFVCLSCSWKPILDHQKRSTNTSFLENTMWAIHLAVILLVVLYFNTLIGTMKPLEFTH